MRTERNLERRDEAILHFLRHPRGHYVADRAAQLSGVPRSTLYDWRRNDVYVPDFQGTTPVSWSYRDLVYLRLLAWLRQIGMPRSAASEQVSEVKRLIATGRRIQKVRASQLTLVLDDDPNTQLGDQNLLPFDDLTALLNTFDLLDPISELRNDGRRRAWGPDLINPSPHTYISPWVLAGDPCIESTRIPTRAIYALREERSLATAQVVALYPGLSEAASDDAHRLERRLRGLDLPDPAAA